MERRREAAGERGWKNGQRAVRLREEARPEQNRTSLESSKDAINQKLISGANIPRDETGSDIQRKLVLIS